MITERILIVDDEPSIRAMLRMTLEYEGYAVEEAGSGASALEAAAAAPPDAVLLDVKMAEMDGIETLERLHADHPELPVILLTGHGTIETAVEATRKGAFDFLSKPPDREKILITIRNAVRQGRLARENARMRAERDGADRMLGVSPAMEQLRALVRRMAPTEAFVLVTGENGTGKELVARALHEGSRRAGRALVEVNCAAIPHDLIESELFGHEKGAFTGATALRVGKFEQADGSTLFLDEIGDMSLPAQAKVLRVLEEGAFERVGGSRLIRVDVRVLAATNKDLEGMIRDGAFREDLYHRLNVLPVRVPPLRERREDIPLLAGWFLEETCRKNKLPHCGIAQDALDLLAARPWPGNVRELRNVMERLAIMVPGEITAVDVRRYAFAQAGDEERESLPLHLGFTDFREAMEREYLLRQLERHGWNVTRTAEDLGMPRSHLYTRIRKHGLTREPGKDEGGSAR